MSSQSSSSKPSKPSKPTPTTTSPSPSPTSKPSVTSHFAMIELKQKIITSLSKLSDRDTHHIAVEDLEKTIQTLTPSTLPILLNSLFDASNDPKPAIKKESIRLLAFLSTSHSNSTQPHLSKIVSHIVKKLKDSDSGVRDACRDAIGVLSGQYLKGDGDNGLIGLFAKPLFDAMGEQNKVVQAGSALCMAKMVECAGHPPPVSGFQKLCPRISKFLNSQNFLARASLLVVIASLSQVGAISAQSLPAFLQNIHECLQSSDWGTRKAAADTLSTLACHSRHLIADGTSATITALEACRFDKVKPVRDSMNEALQLWKKIDDKDVDGVSNGSGHDGKGSQLAESGKSDPKCRSPGVKQLESVKDASIISPPKSLSKAKDTSTSDNTAGNLKKKAPPFSNKELNPEFFQKLALRSSGDSSVEVVVPRRCPNSSKSQAEDEHQSNDTEYGSRSSANANGELDNVQGSPNVKFEKGDRGTDDFSRDKWTEQRLLRAKDPKTRPFDFDDRDETNQRDYSGVRTAFTRNDVHTEGSFMNSKGNWLGIQRQLMQMERQQAHLMDMLQDFMSGSHDGMVTLESRVRGLERVVEDMARDLAGSSTWRGSNFGMGLEGSSNRTLGRYNGFPDYSSAKLGRGNDARVPFLERFSPSDGIMSGSRGRDSLWRSDTSEARDSYSYGASRNGHMGSRRALGGAPNDIRSPRSEHEDDQVGNRRAGDKGPGSIRFGEGPSARSVWQASKDEATLEAIRVAGEDNGISRVSKRVAIPELTAEAEGDDNAGQERSQMWVSWTNAMDALHVGDMDTAYAEVLSTGDEVLLLKLMERTGPIIDQLSNETCSEVLHTIGQFLPEQNLFDIGLSWIQQFVEIVMDNGPDVLGIPIEIKRELLLYLNDASSTIDLPEDWEGATPEQLMLQLASAWEIDLQHFEK